LYSNIKKKLNKIFIYNRRIINLDGLDKIVLILLKKLYNAYYRDKVKYII